MCGEHYCSFRWSQRIFCHHKINKWISQGTAYSQVKQFWKPWSLRPIEITSTCPSAWTKLEKKIEGSPIWHEWSQTSLWGGPLWWVLVALTLPCNLPILFLKKPGSFSFYFTVFPSLNVLFGTQVRNREVTLRPRFPDMCHPQTACALSLFVLPNYNDLLRIFLSMDTLLLFTTNLNLIRNHALNVLCVFSYNSS